MEEKRKMKVNLSTIIIVVLIGIIIAMGLYIYKLNKDKYYMIIGASQKIEELNNKISDLEEQLEKDDNK